MKGGVRHPVDYAAGSSKASGKANRREVKVSIGVTVDLLRGIFDKGKLERFA